MVTESKRVSVFDRLSQSSTYATRDRKNTTARPKTPTGGKSKVTKKLFGVRKVETKPTSATKPTKVAPKIQSDKVVRKKPVNPGKTTTQSRVRKVEPRTATRSRITKSNGHQKVTPGAKNKSLPQKADGKRGNGMKNPVKQGLNMSMRGLSIGPNEFKQPSADALLDFDDDDMSVDEEPDEKLTGVSESIVEETQSVPQDNQDISEDNATSADGISYDTEIHERPPFGKEVSDLTEHSAHMESRRNSTKSTDNGTKELSDLTEHSAHRESIRNSIPTVAEEETTEPEPTETEPTEPKSAELETTEPETTRPESAEQEPTEPEPTEPEPAEPVPTEPEPAEPVPAEPVPTEPVPTEPEPTEPEPTEPEPAEPVPTEPVPTEPVPTEPVPTEPEPTEPEPAEPEPVEPDPVEPKPTDPEPTEPEPTEPEPTEPEPTEPEATQDNPPPPTESTSEPQPPTVVATGDAGDNSAVPLSSPPQESQVDVSHQSDGIAADP